MGSSSSSGARNASPAGNAFPVRACNILSARAVWIFPLVIGSILVALITVFYIGSVVNPLGNLHGLPVAVVNQDQGVTAGTRHVNVSQSVQSGLSHAPAVSGRLALNNTTLRAAEQVMDRGGSYATVVIPPRLTASLLSLAEVPGSLPVAGRPEIVILTNQRAGTEGVALATGVLDPALAAASRQIGGSSRPSRRRQPSRRRERSWRTRSPLLPLRTIRCRVTPASGSAPSTSP